MRMRSGWKWLGLCLWAAHAWLAHAAVEVNQAPAHDLMAIKGIGPATSDKIVQARLAAPFRDWPDFIQRVKGVGPVKATQMSAQGLRVNGQPFAVGDTARASAPAAAPTPSPQVAAANPAVATTLPRAGPTTHTSPTPPPSQPPSGGVIEWRPMVPRPLEKAR